MNRGLCCYLAIAITATPLFAAHPFDQCEFPRLASPQRSGQRPVIVSNFESRGLSRPVRLLNTEPQEVRYAVGVLAKLKDGSEVLAISSGGVGNHERLWDQIQNKYPGQVSGSLWWGEAEISNSERKAGPGVVTRANETSGTFKDLVDEQLNIPLENDVRHLVTALQRLDPKRIQAENTTRFDPDKDASAQHLKPFLVGRHASGNTLLAVTSALEIALTDYKEKRPTTEMEFEQIFQTGSIQRTLFQNTRLRFATLLEALRNDDLISRSEHQDLLQQHHLLATQPPDYTRATKFLESVRGLSLKMKSLRDNPDNQIELIHIPAARAASRNNSPPSSNVIPVPLF